MVGWAAANVSSSRRQDEEDRRRGDGTRNTPSTSSETAEAALARLTRSYSAAMTCVGALHRVSRALLQKRDKPTENGATNLEGAPLLDSNNIGSVENDQQMEEVEDEREEDDPCKELHRVAWAARTLFEGSILLDPLVRQHTSTFSKTIEDYLLLANDGEHSGCTYIMEEEHTHMLQEALNGVRPPPPSLTSASHRSTVQELAYLSLVNYADVLLACCTCCCKHQHSRKDILDKGVVSQVEAFLNSNNNDCVWVGESEEMTQRLALVAYCDASDLDGSDPTLWLRVACSARSVGRIVAQRQRDPIQGQNDEAIIVPVYSRLERHALEQGLVCLPPGQAPNRIIVRALQEWTKMHPLSPTSVQSQYPHRIQPDHPPAVKLVLVLPRYSWSTLGRMLMRACREGGAYSDTMGRTELSLSSQTIPFSRQSRAQKAWVTSFGSPQVQLCISLMLTLPPTALGTVCKFLGNDTPKFEATCRAMSVSIISARATMEEERNHENYMTKNSSQDERENEESMEASDSDNAPTTQEAAVPKSSAPDGECESKASRDQPNRSHRSSKRVRSQLITSGKQAERAAKRNSVEYCLVSVLLCCTPNARKYSSLLRKSIQWEDLLAVKQHVLSIIRSVGVSGDEKKDTPGLGLSTAKGRLKIRSNESEARTGNSSLNYFVSEGCRSNSGPMDMLARFLSHVSRHADQVFASESSGVMMLASCVTECFELLMGREGNAQSLSTSWYGPESFVSGRSVMDQSEAFAINLLYAELLLRRCERQGIAVGDYDHDSGVICFLVPTLVRFSDNIGGACTTNKERDILYPLQTRCHWLAATFYLWWSRMPHIASKDSREAESLALEYISKTLSSLELTIPPHIVLTPHLVSLGRQGSHWKELSKSTISLFRDEVQAASVVSLARGRFGDIQDQIRKRWNDSVEQDLLAEDKTTLASIGEDFYRRYDIEYEGLGGKHEELISDFLNSHKGELRLKDHTSKESTSEPKDFSKENPFGLIWDLVPSSPMEGRKIIELSSPCLLTILVVCLQGKSGGCGVQIVSLLIRLALAVLHQRVNVLRQAAESRYDSMNRTSGYTNHDDFSDSEHSSDDDSTRQSKAQHAGLDEILLDTSEFLVSKITELLSTISPDGLIEILKSSDLLTMVHMSLGVASNSMNSQNLADDDLIKFEPALGLFNRIRSLVSILLASLQPDGELTKLKNIYFGGLVQILVSQRQIFPSLLHSRGDNRYGRTLRRRNCISRASFVGSVSCEVAILLSENPFIVTEGTLEPSSLISDFASSEGEGDLGMATLVHLIDTLLWFWKYASSTDAAGVHPPTSVGTNPRIGLNQSNSTDRAIAELVSVPIASAIVALCGSAARSSCILLSDKMLNNGSQTGDSLSDFFDSDESANGYSSDEASVEKNMELSKKRKLLQSLCRSVQCIGLLFGAISENKMCPTKAQSSLRTKHGPLLPLVVVRTLSRIGDIFLLEFQDGTGPSQSSTGLWADQYPFGSRKAGSQLDLTLHRAYRCLHGFTLVGVMPHASGAQVANTVAHGDQATVKPYPPESTTAAAQLYRCIKRAYAHGRRSPPKAALECVALALPKAEPTNVSKSIRKFIFSASGDDRQNETMPLNDGESGLQALLFGFPEWVLLNEQEKSIDIDQETGDARVTMTADEEEINLVRQGISHELARGALPDVSNNNPDRLTDRVDDSTLSAEEREISARHEVSLFKKFDAILEDLCYNPNHCEGWFSAAQCLLMKADIIADRILPINESSCGKDFYIPLHVPRRRNKAKLLEEVIKDQLSEFELNRQSWIPYLGTDLSLYARHAWCTFASLHDCAVEIGKGLDESHTEDMLTEEPTTHTQERNTTSTVWHEIEKQYSKGNYGKWQRYWGGIFVYALRAMASRCQRVSLYLSKKQHNDKGGGENLISEVAESIGISLYGELMGTNTFGYPIYRMPDYKKREFAMCAIGHFQHAIFVLAEQDNNDWELYFMVGKANEKIAKTYSNERFPSCDVSNEDSETVNRACRRYELYMKRALNSYVTALDHATMLDKEGGMDVQAGGSCHAKLEAFYRLHASRLKCLLDAVRRQSDERDAAESEALRLSFNNWYCKPDVQFATLSTSNIRDRVWSVLEDVVSAMAQCRIENPYFHRSVFRHAQALLWAPALCDPITGLREGSFSQIPATKSYRLRGLNSDACAKSAEVIMASLFEKKRAQLCAVWVTKGGAAPSPFAVLNESVRKYDRLRFKYVVAFIDCMKLCKRSDRLETFIQWTSSCGRDLPAYYEASAAAKGGIPKENHSKDCLMDGSGAGFLWSVKSYANRAFAEVIMQQLSEAGERPERENVSHWLRQSYMCYKRLNCSIGDVQQYTHRLSSRPIPEVETLCRIYISGGEDENDITDDGQDSEEDWTRGRKVTLLRAALSRCKKKFPTVLVAKQTRRKRPKSVDVPLKENAGTSVLPASGEGPDNVHTGIDEVGDTRRKKLIRLMASVPAGLRVDDTFEVKVRIESFTTRVKLTVPPGNPTKVKFSVEVPDDDNGVKMKKRVQLIDNELNATKRIRH
mmetsp:Transcript_19287/g.34947  ORF Transcript_19287/g.34947 Transcript_19287/m.34947 type:complete len:2537 (-) Transcript_19287:2523-10133(-)